MKKLNIHIIQFDVMWGNPEENIARMRDKIVSLPDGPSMVILPELWTCSYDYEGMQEHSRSSPAAIDMLSEMSSAKGMILVGGSVPWTGDNGELANRCFVVNDAGTVIGHYDKCHLFPLLDEPDHFLAGQKPLLFEAFGVTTGLAICYDIRFPEYIRSLALAGAEIIMVPAQWPLPRLDHWTTLLKARAIENQLFVVGCNRCGEGGGEIYGGSSVVFGPDGALVSECQITPEEISSVEIDILKLRKIRKQFPFTGGRNPLLYSPVTSFVKKS